MGARTYLQPQLNKAVTRGSAASDPNTDRNPKDYIVYDKTQLEPDGTPERDNTGTRGKFDADAPFPTLHFPSDHAVLLTVLKAAGMGEPAAVAPAETEPQAKKP